MIYIENAMKRVPSISIIHLLAFFSVFLKFERKKRRKTLTTPTSAMHMAGVWFAVVALCHVDDSRNDKPK